MAKTYKIKDFDKLCKEYLTEIIGIVRRTLEGGRRTPIALSELRGEKGWLSTYIEAATNKLAMKANATRVIKNPEKDIFISFPEPAKTGSTENMTAVIEVQGKDAKTTADLEQIWFGGQVKTPDGKISAVNANNALDLKIQREADIEAADFFTKFLKEKTNKLIELKLKGK